MQLTACIQWLWRASYGIRLRLVASAVCGLLYVGASLAFVWVSKRLVDIATARMEGDISPYAVILLGCMAAQLLLMAASNRIDALSSVQLKNSLRYRLFARIMESRLMRKELPHTGDMMNRLEEDVRMVTEAVCVATPAVMGTLVQLMAAFTFLLVLQPMLAWVLLGIMPVALLVSKVYMTRMRRLTVEMRTTESLLQTHVQEHLQHRTLIRTLEQIPRTLASMVDIQGELYRQVTRRTDFTLFSRTIVQGGFAAGYATAFLWGVWGLHQGAVTFGMMTAFLQLVAQMQRPVVELSRYLPSFIYSVTSAERLANLDALPAEQQGEPQWLGQSVGIRMEEVDFSYTDTGRKVIQGFSHDFTPGSFTALVGETGVGKSTLLRLVLALLMPKNGKVELYNNTESAPVSAQTRCNIVYVPQGNTLLSGSVRDNLLLGNPEATEARLCEVLHTAAAEFVFELPEGLDTFCSEGGTGLSEGQAQRIAIARGLLRPGGILLLDEPTSSLDEQTEQTLLERLAAHSEGKTILLVTHRQAAAQCADNILTLKKISL